MSFSNSNLHILSEWKSVLLTKTYIIFSPLKSYEMQTLLHYLDFSEGGVQAQAKHETHRALYLGDSCNYKKKKKNQNHSHAAVLR